MITKGKFWVWIRRAALASLLAVLALGVAYQWMPKSLRAGLQLPPPFDFSDAFYTKNGIKIDRIQNLGPDSRVGFAGDTQAGAEFGANPKDFGGQYNWLLDPSNTDPTRKGVRTVQTTGGFDKDGNLIYYSIMAPVPDQTFFTEDDAGSRAHDLANRFRAFIFPKQFKSGAMRFETCPVGVQPGTAAGASCIVLNPGPGNRRQDNLFETKDEYFCGNLLGLWLLEMVIYTPQIQSLSGQIFLSYLAAKNGVNLDGTPVLKTLAEIEGLAAGGYAKLVELPDAPHPGPGTPRYVV